MSKLYYENYGLDYKLTLKSPLAVEDLVLNLIVVEINMFEDMYGPFMRMEIVLNDSLGLMDKFPIIGDEELEFKYKNPNEQEFYQYFKVYSVTNRQVVKARAHGLVLHAISEPGHKNALESVYKSFIDKKCDDIVRETFDQYLASIGKMIRIPESCENEYTKVANGQNPLKLINEVAAEAKSTSHEASNYVFFEAADDFHYAPISYFLTQSPVYEYFLSVPQEDPQYRSGSKNADQSIRSINFVNNFDNLDSVYRGGYMNEINFIDPILKRFEMHPIKDKTKYQFEYIRDFDSLTHLPNSAKKMISAEGDVGKAEKPYAAHRRMFVTQHEKDGEDYPTIGYLDGKIQPGDVLNSPRQRQKYLNKSLHEKHNLSNHVLEITVSGIPEVYVGQVIKIKLPQPTQISDETTKFLFLYGQEATFLVTAVRHIYKADVDAYYAVLSCSKESFGEEPRGRKFDNRPKARNNRL